MKVLEGSYGNPVARGIRRAVFLGVLVLVSFPPLSLAQDILIFRPVANSETIYRAPEIVFEAEISAFSNVLEVKINGEPLSVAQTDAVTVQKPLTLEPGRNVVVVEVRTELGSAKKEFVIRLLREGEEIGAEEKRPFRVIVVAGLEDQSNAAKTKTEFGGLRTFLVAIPEFTMELDDGSKLKYQAIVSRDKYDKDELAGQEIAFTQLTARWERPLEGEDFWTVGAGLNTIDQKFDSLLEGEIPVEDDLFFFGTLHKSTGGTNFYEVALEIKDQDLADPADADLNDDATVISLKGVLDRDIAKFRGKFRAGYAITDATGKLRSKTTLQAGAELGYPLAELVEEQSRFSKTIVGFGLRYRADAFDEPASPTSPAPEETLTTLFLNAIHPISKTWIISAEYRTESQSSNVAASEYDNTALMASVIYIY